MCLIHVFINELWFYLIKLLLYMNFFLFHASDSSDETAESILNEICPDATNSDIQIALNQGNGDPNEAAQHLLGNCD